jgi:nicotinamide-nucleotide amidase
MELQFTQVDEAIVRRAADVLRVLEEHGCSVATAESCTGGLVAALLSEGPGAAKCLQAGFVTYTEASKRLVLGVSAELLNLHGPVSAEVARAMVEGALARSPAQVAVSVTGVAGPEPDERGTPVGLMFFGYGRRGMRAHVARRYFGIADRGTLRYRAVESALDLVIEAARGW